MSLDSTTGRPVAQARGLAGLDRVWRALQMPLLATLAGLLLTSALLLTIQVNPLDVYAALLRGALGSLFGISSWASPRSSARQYMPDVKAAGRGPSGFGPIFWSPW